MELRQETQLAVQRRNQSPTYTTTLRLYPNTTSNEPSVHQSENLQWGYKLPNNIIPSHQYSIKGEQEMIIKPQRRHQSTSTARASQHMIPSMAGSRTYVGPVYYDSQQPVTINALMVNG